MMRSRGGPGASGSKAGYTKLPSTEQQADAATAVAKQQGQQDLRPNYYKLDDNADAYHIVPVPTASIALAIFLMLFGMMSLVLAWMHFTQQILGKQQAEIGFTVLGLLTFIPGFFHCRIAYYTWKGYPGYTWDKIPAWT